MATTRTLRQLLHETVAGEQLDDLFESLFTHCPGLERHTCEQAFLLLINRVLNNRSVCTVKEGDNISLMCGSEMLEDIDIIYVIDGLGTHLPPEKIESIADLPVDLNTHLNNVIVDNITFLTALLLHAAKRGFAPEQSHQTEHHDVSLQTLVRELSSFR